MSHKFASRTPILQNWSSETFEEHQPIMMFPIGLGQILRHNLAKSTQSYEGLVGHNAGAAAAEANAEQGREQRKLLDLAPNQST
jgi:hypothetical protein